MLVLGEGRAHEFALRVLETGAQDYLVKGIMHGARLSDAIQYAVERKRVTARGRPPQHHDLLTGLANRRAFDEEISRRLAESDANGPSNSTLSATFRFVDC